MALLATRWKALLAPTIVIPLKTPMSPRLALPMLAPLRLMAAIHLELRPLSRRHPPTAVILSAHPQLNLLHPRMEATRLELRSSQHHQRMLTIHLGLLPRPLLVGHLLQEQMTMYLCQIWKLGPAV